MSIRTYIKKDDYDLLHFRILNAIYSGAKTCRTIDDIIATFFKDSEDYVKTIILNALTKCKNYIFALSKLECDGMEYDALNELLKIETEPNQEKKRKMESEGLKHDIDFMPDEFRFFKEIEKEAKQNVIDDPYSVGFEYFKKKMRITTKAIRKREMKMKQKRDEDKTETVNFDNTGTIMDFILVAAKNTPTSGKLSKERTDEILSQFSSQELALDGIDDMNDRIKAIDRAILEFKDIEFYPIIMVMILLLKYWEKVKLLEPNAETNPGGFIYSSITKIWLEFLEFFIEGSRGDEYVKTLKNEKDKLEKHVKYLKTEGPGLTTFGEGAYIKMTEYIKKLPRFKEINLKTLGVGDEKVTKDKKTYWIRKDLKKIFPVVLEIYKTELQKYKEKIKFASEKWRWDKDVAFNINVKKLLFKMVHVYYEIYDIMFAFENIDPKDEIRKRKQSHYLSFDFGNFKSKHLRHLLALVEANVLYKDIEQELEYENRDYGKDFHKNVFVPEMVLDLNKLEVKGSKEEMKQKFFDYFENDKKYDSDEFEYIEYDFPETEYQKFLESIKKVPTDSFFKNVFGAVVSRFVDLKNWFKSGFNKIGKASIVGFFDKNKPDLGYSGMKKLKRGEKLKGYFGDRSLFLNSEWIDEISNEPNKKFAQPLAENALLYDAILCHMNKMRLMKGVGYFDLYFLPLYVIMKICMENRLDLKNLEIPMSSEFFFSEKKIINPTTLTPLLSKRNRIRTKFVEDTTVGVAGIMNFYLVYDETTGKKIGDSEYFKNITKDKIKIFDLYKDYNEDKGYFYWIIKRFNEKLKKEKNKIIIKKYVDEMKRHFRVFANENIKHNAPFLASSNLTIVGKLEERISKHETVLLREYEDYDFKEVVPAQDQNIEKGFSDYSNYINRFIHDFSKSENINLLLLAQVILYFYNINTKESDNIFKELAWFFIDVKKTNEGSYKGQYRVGCPIIGTRDDYGNGKKLIFGIVKEYDGNSDTYTINPYFHNERKKLKHLNEISDGLEKRMSKIKPIVDGLRFPIFYNPLLVPLHDPLKYVNDKETFTENEFSYVDISELYKFDFDVFIEDKRKVLKE